MRHRQQLDRKCQALHVKVNACRKKRQTEGILPPPNQKRCPAAFIGRRWIGDADRAEMTVNLAVGEVRGADEELVVRAADVVVLVHFAAGAA